jgi:hypothetical protein
MVPIANRRAAGGNAMTAMVESLSRENVRAPGA